MKLEDEIVIVLQDAAVAVAAVAFQDVHAAGQCDDEEQNWIYKRSRRFCI